MSKASFARQGDIDKMEDSTANDPQQISGVGSVGDPAEGSRLPLVTGRSIRLLFLLNSIAFIVIGLGFLFNVETIFPRAASVTPVVSTELESGNGSLIDTSGTTDASDVAAPKTDSAVIQTTSDGVSLPARILDFVQFSVLLLIGVICGLISLGCLALISDRPFGDFMAAIIGISACLWLSGLALFVPAPERYLSDPIQYSVAGIILWISSSWLLGLGTRVGLSFTGGTVAALGIMALGSRVVVWATWS